MKRLPVHGLDPSTTNGDVLTTVSGKATWAPATGGSGGRWEVLMADGVTSPPEPLWNEDGTDWLYGEVTP